MARVEGLDRLKRRFARLPVRMRTEIKASLEKSADELVAMQKRLVAVDDGDLRDSIVKKPGRHELSVSVTGGDEKAFYARFIEFGTVDQPAQPFFFVAYRTLRRRIRSRITRAAKKALKANG